jgi:hypothetical protein
MPRTVSIAIAVIGIDIGKNSFHDLACARRIDNGQPGMKERHPGTNKGTERQDSSDRGTPPRSARGTERWRSVFPARANTGDPNGPTRGRSANQIARALISMMARSNELQSEAGYIDARPLSQLDDPSCDARPDHTSGSVASRANHATEDVIGKQT